MSNTEAVLYCKNGLLVKFLFPFSLQVINGLVNKAQYCNAYLVSVVDGYSADVNPLKEMF